MLKKYLYIVFIGFLLFVPFLGSVHLLDWDEANFAELAREMIVSGDFLQPQINFLPFYEKPPLFIWFQVLSMKLFGINEFGARFPNAICGILVLCSLYTIGRKHYSERMAWLWVFSFGASIAPHFYFKTGLIDPFFNFFIFLSIYYFSFLFLSTPIQRLKYSLLSALFAAMAILTKGPVAIILICGSLGLGWVLMKFRSWKNLGWSIPWGIVTVGLSGIWFWVITQRYGNTYVHEFIDYQLRLFQTEDAKHGGTIFFHPVALILGCFPASIFMWSAFRKSVEKKSEIQEILFKLMMSCGIVVLVVFSLVQTKIIHYSSMDYYPISFFSAIGLNYLIENKYKLAKWQTISLWIVFSVWTIALIFTPIAGNHIENLKPFIQDKNFLEQLNTPIVWNYWAIILGVIVLICVVYGYREIMKNLHKGVIILFLTSLVITHVVSLYYLPRIEKIVQGSLVEFCTSIKDQDVNTCALYVKSYNQFFYSQRMPFQNKEQGQAHNYYLYDSIKKNCYFIMRTIDTAKLDSRMGSHTKKMYNQNGFTYYLRMKF